MGNNAASAWYRDCLARIAFVPFWDLGCNLALCFIRDRTSGEDAFNYFLVIVTSVLNIRVKYIRDELTASGCHAFRRILRFTSVSQVERTTRGLRNVNKGFHTERSIHLYLAIDRIARRRESILATFTRDK